jgi:hypothetical protein
LILTVADWDLSKKLLIQLSLYTLKEKMHMAQPAFFIFGQGHRRKLLYQHGTLVDLNAGTILLETEPAEEVISDSDYTVSVRSKKGESIIICENQSGIQLDYNEQHTILDEGEINLPSFTLHPYQRLLRILHHEILINIVDGYPVPNFLVYNKPWYRDAAMMAMVLEKTGNTCLLQKWIGSLDELYDRNNAGCEEPDNLGQLLYLISLLELRRLHGIIT